MPSSPADRESAATSPPGAPPHQRRLGGGTRRPGFVPRTRGACAGGDGHFRQGSRRARKTRSSALARPAEVRGLEDRRLSNADGHEVATRTEKLAGPSASDRPWKWSPRCPGSNALVIEDSPVIGRSLQRLAAVGGLAGRMQSLTFTRCYGVTDDTLRIVTAMPRLESLSIRQCPVTGDFLTRWADMPAERLRNYGHWSSPARSCPPRPWRSCRASPPRSSGWTCPA